MAGTHRADIDLELAATFAAEGANVRQIAAYFGVHQITMRRACQDAGYKGAAHFVRSHAPKGELDLIRAQHRAAIEGNTTILVWLGKQRLGQSDKVQHSSTDPVRLPDVHITLPPAADPLADLRALPSTPE